MASSCAGAAAHAPWGGGGDGLGAGAVGDWGVASRGARDEQHGNEKAKNVDYDCTHVGAHL